MFIPLCLGGGGHRYWRLYLSGADQSGAYQLADEIELRAVSGGADQCSGGVASASNTQAGYFASSAFDGTTALWSSGTSGTTNEWIKYAFPVAVDVGQIAYLSNTLVNNRGPTEIQLQYSDDDSSWTTTRTWSGLTAWTKTPRVLDV